MDILATGLQGFVFGVAVAALVMAVLDLYLTTPAHVDARRRKSAGRSLVKQDKALAARLAARLGTTKKPTIRPAAADSAGATGGDSAEASTAGPRAER